MADYVFTKGMNEMLRGSTNGITWTTDTIEMSLWKVDGTEDKDDEFVSDLVGFTELADASYGRVNLASKTITNDLTNDRVLLDHGDVTYTALAGGETIVSVTIQVNGASDAASRLIYHGDSFSSIVTNGSNVVVSTPATGAFYLQV